MRWAIVAPAVLLAGMCFTRPADAFGPLDALQGLLSLPFGGPFRGYYGPPARVRHRAPAGRESEGGGAIKPGLWEFHARLAGGSAAARPGSGGLTTTRTGCIDAKNVVPVELGPQCRLDKSRRDGRSVTWSMSCSNAENTVRSDGTAQYQGDTMAATVISHLPIGNGATSNIPEQIDGRYLGACTAPAQIAGAPAAAPPAGGGPSRSGD